MSNPPPSPEAHPLPPRHILDAKHGEGHSILVVDDLEDNVAILAAHLQAKGYRTLTAYDGADALRLAINEQPDLILLDVEMPGLSGLDVCSQLKQRPATSMIPIILVTAHSETADIVRGLELGADDYLVKPYNYVEMLARVRSMLRIRDTQQALFAANRELDELNRDLERKVQEQVRELERVNRLRRFFSPQIVKTIISENAEHRLQEHRGEVTVVFLDLRKFTSFAAGQTPQRVIRTIREMHQVVGPIIFDYHGTLERFAGDGLMVFLGDPEPMPDHPLQSVRMGIEIRRQCDILSQRWLAEGIDLRMGIGISTGEAALGTIGFEGRLDYAAIGTVTNLAARLCSLAAGGEILISASTQAKLDGQIPTRPRGLIELKGFPDPVQVYEVA